jgi:hypothetical protein
MPLPFTITGLDPADFVSWHALDDAGLAQRGGRRVRADAQPGYPCRVSLEDAAPGETLILMPFVHHDVPGPYRASGPIFVRARAQARQRLSTVPQLLRHRNLSLRAYDGEGQMIDAALCQGIHAEEAIESLLRWSTTAYLHVHFAGHGCYACRVERA